MNLPLTKKVYFSLAIEYLGFGNMELSEAIRTLCILAGEDNLLSLYFDDNTYGFEADLEENLVWGPVLDDGPSSTAPPAYQYFSEKKKVKSPFNLYRKDGRFLCHLKSHDVESAHQRYDEAWSNPGAVIEKRHSYRDYMCTSCQENTCNTWQFKINYFEIKDISYRAYSPTDLYTTSIFIDYTNTYFLKDDLIAFKAKMDGGQLNKSHRIDPRIKALALIARDKAEETIKYKNGTKVNASAVKEYLITLANKYEISAHGLKAIDDQISSALNELDLKEVPPKTK